MSVVNFAISSDYKWFLFGVAALWAGAVLVHQVAVARGGTQ
jgi:hypothetical protein